MATIIRDRDYIIKMRRKAVKHTVLWLVALILIFVAGLIISKGSKQSYFTVVAALFSIPVAQNVVAVLAYTVKSADHQAYDDKVKGLGEGAEVYISSILAAEKNSVFVNYIIHTASEIYVLADFSVFPKNAENEIKNLWQKKGISEPVKFYDYSNWDTAINEISAADKSKKTDRFTADTLIKLML